MNEYPFELMDRHDEVCLKMQTKEQLPVEERQKVEQQYEELTKQILSYCL